MINTDEKYIIGETAYNHEGDLLYLYRMIDDISELGLNAIKFHILLNPNSYIQKKHALFNELKKWIFDESHWIDIINYSKNKKLDVVMLCDDVESVNFIVDNDLDVDSIEIHASGLNDFFMLDALSNWDKNIILGIGGSQIDEIVYALNILGKKNIILMYGFQNYPTDYETINLSKMIKIKNLFDLPVGYADHTAYDDPYNEIISAMPSFMGINILEKHYTPDVGVERIDYHAAIGKKEILKIKNYMNLALSVLGTGDMALSEPEKAYGNLGPMKKAIVAKKCIKKGQKLSKDNLWFKRTVEESYIPQNQFFNLLCLKALKDIKTDELITFENVEYKFKTKNLNDFTNIRSRKL